MRFLHSDLGWRQRGDVLEVTLSRGANVRLMDSSNFHRYKRGEGHRCLGGLAKRSPVRIPIPSAGHWHAAVDMQGLRGSTSASFRVINRSTLQPLPPIRERRPDLNEIASNMAEISQDNREFDVFVSHAAEDKEAVVRPLAHALQERGLSVWYDEFELRIGDSLRQRIDRGIAHSKFGLVVLSNSFFAKGWPQYELDGLVTMAVSAKQVLLPIWHEISKDEVVSQSPSLADKVALKTSDFSISKIADEIAAVVQGP
ncbi:MAG: DUF1883 domain-containing protein [bacterium]|nr:DUF1883 domain-containing protein [bacterium]